MNIVLIGYRGAGKSQVGALLAERLHWPCVALDALIVERAGLLIPEIVAREGWSGFRDRESAVVREVAARDQVIIDTGGGVIERQENIAAFQATGQLIWLKASVDTIVHRIQDDTQRPSLTGNHTFTEEVAEVLARRNPRYRRAARDEIDTDGLTLAEVANRVMELLGIFP